MGITLRSFLVLHMQSMGTYVRVADLVTVMEAEGFAVAGRPSKVISDCLRWEVARRRVRRVRRGVYVATGHTPRSTRRRMLERVAAARRNRPPLRTQPLREARPLVSPDGPWRYHLRYGLGPPRRPRRQRPSHAQADASTHRSHPSHAPPLE
jgi:hypothetical protein